MGTELKVLTQNVWGVAGAWALRREMLAKTIAREQPDLVGMQEVLAPDDTGAGSQAHEIAALAGGYHACFAPARRHRRGAWEGVALLSRTAVAGSAQLPLPGVHGDRLDVDRMVLGASVHVVPGGADCRVFVTHLSLSARARVRTVRLMTEHFDDGETPAPEPALLLGDLNANHRDACLDPLLRCRTERRWLDVWAAAHGTARGGTWPALWPAVRLDFVLARPSNAWRILECRRIGPTGSDHLGVLARLALASREDTTAS